MYIIHTWIKTKNPTNIKIKGLDLSIKKKKLSGER